MGWFAATAVLYFKHRTPQKQYDVLENVYLIDAESGAAAFRMATKFAKEDAHDAGGTLRVGGRPAKLVFGGIRKVIECKMSMVGQLASPESRNLAIDNGTEATYSFYTVNSVKSLRALIKGQPVRLLVRE